MADEATPQAEVEEPKPKKKGGKLPVLLMLLLLLGGGGYFGMKFMSKGKPAKVEIKLGETVPLSEFLVNLRGNSSYARVEISVHLREGYGKDKFEKNIAAVRDRVILILCQKSLAEVGSMDGKVKLKGEIATALNEVISALDPEAVPKEAAQPAPQGKDKGGAPSDWDSQTGPVLKVYFTGFATQ
jgi:flagellar FliL protein